MIQLELCTIFSKDSNTVECPQWKNLLMVEFFYFLLFLEQIKILMYSTLIAVLCHIKCPLFRRLTCVSALYEHIKRTIGNDRYCVRSLRRWPEKQIYSSGSLTLVTWKMNWSRNLVLWTESIDTRFSLESCIVQHFNHRIVKWKKAP